MGSDVIVALGMGLTVSVAAAEVAVPQVLLKKARYKFPLSIKLDVWV